MISGGREGDTIWGAGAVGVSTGMRAVYACGVRVRCVCVCACVCVCVCLHGGCARRVYSELVPGEDAHARTSFSF